MEPGHSDAIVLSETNKKNCRYIIYWIWPAINTGLILNKCFHN